jgi:hypothetical protein
MMEALKRFLKKKDIQTKHGSSGRPANIPEVSLPLLHSEEKSKLGLSKGLEDGLSDDPYYLEFHGHPFLFWLVLKYCIKVRSIRFLEPFEFLDDCFGQKFEIIFMKILDQIFRKKEEIPMDQFEELLYTYFPKKHIAELIEKDPDSFNDLIMLVDSFLDETEEIIPLLKNSVIDDAEFMKKVHLETTNELKTKNGNIIRVHKTPAEIVEVFKTLAQEQRERISIHV